MKPRSLAAPALRPFLASDAPALAAIFREAIEDLTGEDYSVAQQAAWAALADDEQAFGAKLARISLSSPPWPARQSASPR